MDCDLQDSLIVLEELFFTLFVTVVDSISSETKKETQSLREDDTDAQTFSKCIRCVTNKRLNGALF